MLLSFSSVALTTLLQAALTVAQSVGNGDPTGGNFTYPSPMDYNIANIFATFAIGTKITLQWTTVWNNLDLVIFQYGQAQLQYLPNSRTLLVIVDSDPTNSNLACREYIRNFIRMDCRPQRTQREPSFRYFLWDYVQFWCFRCWHLPSVLQPIL